MVLWIIAAFISGFIKGLCGVGDAPIFAAILLFNENNIDISPVGLITSFVTNSWMIWKNRASLITKVWVPMALMLIAGSIPGTLLLKNVDTGKLKLAFGVFIIIIGIIMLINELHAKKVNPSKLLLVTVGVLAGLGSGLFGVGILLVVYVSMTTDDMKAFKANICAIFAAENVVRLIMYGILGILTTTVLKRAVMIAPFIALGMFLGVKSADHLDDRKAKIAVMIMMILSGIAIIISNL